MHTLLLARSYISLPFILGDSIRTDFVMGKDLGKIRYLLPPIKDFYEATIDPLYQAYYSILKKGLSAPSLGMTTRKKMQDILKKDIF